MKVLGIIPARGGSKRVPGKNVKLLNGVPLIGYSINAAKKSKKLFDTIVSTDDEDIAEVAVRMGGKAPFLRPKEMSVDRSGDRAFLIHALRWYEEAHQVKIDAVCLLRPTSPFRSATLIDKGVDILEQKKCDSVRSMTEVFGVHHPYWMFKEENGSAENLMPDVTIEKYYQSQLLPPVFRLNGCVDLIKSTILLDESEALYGQDMKILKTSEKEALDIDTFADFNYCEWLMKNNQEDF